MSATKPDADTGWSKGLPDAEGDYFCRVDEYDKLPTLIRIQDYVLYEIGQGGNLRREYAAEVDYEYLGPFTASDFEQLIRLREWKESAMTLLSRYDSIAETFGGKLGSSKIDNLERGVEQLRAAARNAMEWMSWWVESEGADLPDGVPSTPKILAALREALAHTGEQS